MRGAQVDTGDAPIKVGSLEGYGAPTIDISLWMVGADLTQVVGILSDLLMPIVGSDSLRYAMLTMSLVALWSAYHFWNVGRTVRADLAAAYA